MNILAIYDHDQLDIPSKVLTHREDIDPLLAELGVRLQRLESLPRIAEDDTDQDVIAVLRPILVEDEQSALFKHFRIHRKAALPGYADQTQNSEVEEYFPQQTAKLLVSGAGIMCLHHEHRLLVLRCQRGDLLHLPERLGHWFVASAGRSCLIVRAAATEDGLMLKQTGDDIAARYQMLDL